MHLCRLASNPRNEPQSSLPSAANGRILVPPQASLHGVAVYINIEDLLWDDEDQKEKLLQACQDRGDAPILCQFHCFLGKDLGGNAGCTYALFGHLGDERSPDFYVHLTLCNTHTTTGDDLTRDHYQVEHCLDKIFTHYKTTASENCTNYHFRTDGCA